MVHRSAAHELEYSPTRDGCDDVSLPPDHRGRRIAWGLQPAAPDAGVASTLIARLPARGTTAALDVPE